VVELMSRHREYRVLMAGIGAVCALGAVSSVVPVVEHVVGAVLVAAALVWLAVALTRRERRIRARLADLRTRPAPAPGPRGPSSTSASSVRGGTPS
jgi:hypothetical protein